MRGDVEQPVLADVAVVVQVVQENLHDDWFRWFSIEH